MAVPTLSIQYETTTGVFIELGTLTSKTNINQPFDRNNDSFLAGTATFTFKDTTGAYNPNNASSTYGQYMVPGKTVKIRATYGGTTYDLFYGWSQSFTYRPAFGDDVAAMTVTVLDYLGILAQINMSTCLYYATDGTTTGYRIYGIWLTSVYWGGPTPAQSIYIGGSYVQADPGTTRTVLQAMQTIDNTENGALFFSKNGTLTWYSRDQIYRRSSNAPVSFTDQGAGITYQDVSYKYDTDFIANYATVGAPGLIASTVYDPTSIGKYFKRDINRTDVLMNNVSDQTNLALMLVYGRTNPILRIYNFKLNADGSDATRTAAALALDFYKPIRVTRHDPANVAITKDLLAVGFTWDITPTKFDVTVTTAEPDLYGFVLDGTYPLAGGILGTNQLTY
jgi:hypothetical protein